ncbi:MAG: serine hydrolase domain-containing protein [Pirellulaceae bacterium]
MYWRIKFVAVVGLCFVGLADLTLVAQQAYFPGQRDDWKTVAAAEAGFDAEKLNTAVEFAKAAANQDTRDLAQSITNGFGREPHFSIVGPTKERGDASGMIIRGGMLVAEWGDTHRVDMTFSVTKSYLSTMAGLALDDGLIADVHDPVRKYVADGTFDGEHNRDITWHHLLQQTSDWSGELWGKPDWADRPVGATLESQQAREMHAPGTHYKYNDVRVNLLAYCLTNVWRRPLPVVLRERIMDPIDASPTWRWHGYENSWITLDGQKVQVVSGGGHWGGGMFISTRDHARFGLLFLRNGKWSDQQLISDDWIKAIVQPSEVKRDYGYMWWLNTDLMRMQAAPADSYSAAGFGGNYIYVDPDNDLVVVLRWTNKLPEVLGQILDALQ